MKAKIIFSCGCEIERELDGQVCWGKGDVNEAKKTNVILRRKYMCMKCKNKDLIEFVAGLEKEELVAIMIEGLEDKMSTAIWRFRNVRRMPKNQLNC